MDLSLHETKVGSNGMRTLGLLLCLALGVFFWDSPVLWPVKLLVVMVHETGHAVGTLVVGGSVDQVVLGSDESGACLSMLPRSVLGKIVVYSAGYVGSSLAGALMLLATLRWRWRRSVLGLFCVWMVVMGALYAGNLFTFAFCAGTAVLFGLAARLLPDRGVEALNLFLAAFISLYAVFDLRSDLWNSSVRDRSDAALLADQTLIPALVWAALWTALSLGVLALALKVALKEPPRVRLDMRSLR